MECLQRQCQSHFSLFFPLLRPSLPSASRSPCSPPVSPSVRLCQRSKRFSSLCRNSPSLSSLYLFILGKLKCSKHTPMEKNESCLTVLYKPPITSHHSSPHNRRNLCSPTRDLLSFLSGFFCTSFCQHFTELLSFYSHIKFTCLCGPWPCMVLDLHVFDLIGILPLSLLR